jgi:hypothetical protein
MSKKDKNTIDLPEVSDIPGQEHVKPPRLGELSDMTSSSADEEGDDILEPEDEDSDIVMDKRSNVSREERAILANTGREGVDSEDEGLRSGLLDSTDDDGDPLNEKSFGEGRNDDLSADDLDVPGASDDDADEEVGEEDEENEDYSLSDNNENSENENENENENEG